MPWDFDSEELGLGVQILEQFAQMQAPETHRVMVREEIRRLEKTSVFGLNASTPEKKRAAKRRYLDKLKRNPARYEVHKAVDRARKGQTK